MSCMSLSRFSLSFYLLSHNVNSEILVDARDNALNRLSREVIFELPFVGGTV